MVGGVLEYSSLLIGYRSLLIAVALLYGFAYLFGREHLAFVKVIPQQKEATGTSPA
jgi:hypothetical protein